MKDLTKQMVLLAALVAALALAACGGGGDEEETQTVSGRFAALPSAPAPYDEVAGTARLTRDEDGTAVSVSLSGLEPGAEYVAHLHTQGCDQPDPGGPHFQFEPGGSDEPPNEIHLSFKAGEAGEASARVRNPREVPAGEAGSVVVHRAGAHSRMALFVHEGKGHGGKGHEGGGHDQPSPPDKVACAELEGAGGAASAEPTIVIDAAGEPVGGVQQLEYSAGEEIRFRVESDVAEEVHVHGYDLLKRVPAGGSVSFAFPAEIEGIFEVELEGSATLIAELQVNP